jgi:hypothetical protein
MATRTNRQCTGSRQRLLPALLVLGLTAVVTVTAWPLGDDSPLLVVTLVAAAGLVAAGLSDRSLVQHSKYRMAVALVFVSLGASLLLSDPGASKPTDPAWLFVLTGGAVALSESTLARRLAARVPVQRATVLTLLFATAGALVSAVVVQDALATGYDAVTATGLFGGGGLIVLIVRDYLRGSPEAKSMAADDETFVVLLAFGLYGLVGLAVGLL